ncbi:MAG TPA: hypothetical protein DCZ92_07360 [Elusimicrobia bacterium]|nr:MAG: hypothetical protein A2016_03715 [Elusimicrobia bacterium GWF2_62_30]HBA60624.1 hypothetical protein [Elusimicrobiota bacterium]
MKAVALVFSILIFSAQAATAAILSVGTELANVRSGPGADYEVAWEAVRYYPLEILDREGNWLKVSDYVNDEGWIYQSLLSGVPSVVVISEKANLRKGPGMGYGIAQVLDKEYCLKVLEVQGLWIKVTDNETVTGWIHNSVVWGFTESPALEKQPAH